MNITLSFDSEAVDREFVPVEVSSDMSVNDFLAYIEAESTIPPNSQILIYKGDTLPTTTDAHREQKLSSLGLQDGDMILVRDIRQVSAPLNNRPRLPSPKTLRNRPFPPTPQRALSCLSETIWIDCTLNSNALETISCPTLSFVPVYTNNTPIWSLLFMILKPFVMPC